MDSEFTWKVKLIIDEISGLEIREEELANNNDLHSMYLTDWINNLSRLSSIWNVISDDQRKQINDAYTQIKMIALKLKLPWPDELSMSDELSK